MEVGRITLTTPCNTVQRNKNINFEGRMLDDRVIREVLNNAPKISENDGFLSRVGRYFKNLIKDGHTVVLDSKGNRVIENDDIFEKVNGVRVRKDGKSGSFYSVLYDAIGKPYAIMKETYKKGILKKYKILDFDYGIEKHVYINDGRYAVLERDMHSGKLDSDLLIENKDGQRLMIRDKDGRLVHFNQKGACLSEDSFGIHGRLRISKDDKTVYYIDRMPMSLRERLKAEDKLTLKSFFKCLMADKDNYEKAPLRCSRYTEPQGDLVEAVLPIDTSISDIIRMRDNGELQKLNFVPAKD